MKRRPKNFLIQTLVDERTHARVVELAEAKGQKAAAFVRDLLVAVVDPDVSLVDERHLFQERTYITNARARPFVWHALVAREVVCGAKPWLDDRAGCPDDMTAITCVRFSPPRGFCGDCRRLLDPRHAAEGLDVPRLPA